MHYSTQGAQFCACVQFTLLCDKLLRTTTEDLLYRESSMNWLWKKRRGEKEYCFSFSFIFMAFIYSEQDGRGTNQRVGKGTCPP